ncbi:MAG: class I SAM-dependent methyltransferase [Candidatus Competibacteraceae bacterium]|nr:class I SAM-dependent methyltransferase [Candidatus Competibacteraceae bacterium]
MYSEAEDFREKREAYSRMENALDHVFGAEVIRNLQLALEIGGSGGLLAGMVSNAGPKVICTDIVDVQVKYNGEFPRLLKEKFERNGFVLDLGKIEFHTMDAQCLIYGNDKFDLVFSLNALEHIPDPVMAIKEIWRVLKPGGAFYASFDPVWTADSGSHFIHYTREPWLHLLVDDDDYCALMKLARADDWELSEYRCAMNRLPATFYMKEMKEVLEKIFSKYSLTHWSGCISEEFVNHQNRLKAENITGLSSDELLIRGFQITALK